MLKFHLLRDVLSTAGEIAVTAALLHVFRPQKVEFFITISPHTLISLTIQCAFVDLKLHKSCS